MTINVQRFFWENHTLVICLIFNCHNPFASGKVCHAGVFHRLRINHCSISVFVCIHNITIIQPIFKTAFPLQCLRVGVNIMCCQKRLCVYFLLVVRRTIFQNRNNAVLIFILKCLRIVEHSGAEHTLPNKFLLCRHRVQTQKQFLIFCFWDFFAKCKPAQKRIIIVFHPLTLADLIFPHLYPCYQLRLVFPNIFHTKLSAKQWNCGNLIINLWDVTS